MNFKELFLGFNKWVSYGINLVLILAILGAGIWYINGLTNMATARPTKLDAEQPK